PGYIPSSGRGSCGRLTRDGVSRAGRGRLLARSRHAHPVHLDSLDDLRNRTSEDLAFAILSEREGQDAQIEHLLLAPDDALDEAVDAPFERLRLRLALHRHDPAKAERTDDFGDLGANLGGHGIPLGRRDREPLT